jgi:serine/threonine-protein kinase
LLPARLELLLSQSLAIHGSDRDIAISRDGRYIAYRSGAGVAQLVVRAIDRLDAEPIAGITNARQPFFSPDGRWIGYFDGANLKKVATAGGPPITVLQIRGVPRGASWGDDDQIVFATTEVNRGLQRVPASGGDSSVLTTPDTANGETNHWYPSVLPGGRGVLFSLTAPNGADRAQVGVLDLKTGRRKTLIRGSQAEYVANGYLLFASAGVLHAARFDLERLAVLSNPEPVVDDVWTAGGGAANYAVSSQGTLVYIPATALRPRSLVWVDRNGHETTIPAPPRAYFEPRLSPDGTRVALSIRDQDNDIWIWDFTRPERALSRLTFGTDLDQRPVWTADGARIVFSSQREGAFNLYAQNADGSGTIERLTNGPYAHAPAFVAPDGTGVLGSEQPPETGGDIVWFPLKNPSSGGVAPNSSSAEPLVRTPAIEYNPTLSPDGRYLAYQSNESGPNEIYVRPYPQVNNGRWQVSTSGGTRPVWARSGQEIFYLDLSNTLTAVPVQTSGSTFTFEKPARVFDTIYAVPLDNSRPYDVAPDGQRFLMIKENSAGGLSATRQGIVVILNWFEELKAKVSSR